MYSIIADTHTHSIASGHAYGSITENCRAAAELGLRFLAITDHTPLMPGGACQFYFDNLTTVPETLCGVNVLRGCEANIMDAEGHVDLPARILRDLDWVIASMHPPVLPPANYKDVTDIWLRVAENPDIDVIGHCGDNRYYYDREKVLCAFAAHGKIVEINAHSLSARPGSPENCREIARLCMRYHVPVVVSTDAHFYTEIGQFSPALEMLAELSFPAEQILNADMDRFSRVITDKTGRTQFL